MTRWLLPLALLLPSGAAFADNVVVGTGTPASCTEAALDAALVTLLVGTQGPGGTLGFACGSAPHTIAIGSQKFLQGQVVIDGGGRIVLDAQNLTRHFDVSVTGPDGRTEATLRNIVLTRGFAAGDHGGAILAHAGVQLALTRVTIRDSRAGGSGGAVGIQPGNTRLDIDDSLFTQNRAGDGGAIATSALTTVRRSRFFGNSADSGQGGAIQAWIEDLSVEDSVFGANSADRGGAIYKRDAHLELQGSRLQDNLAQFDGGAVYAEANVARVAVGFSHFERNLADLAGGAILAARELEVTVSSFDANRAQRGGAIRLLDSQFVQLAYSTFSNNEAETGGGAIAVSATAVPGGNPPVMFVSDSTFAFNRTTAAGAIGGDIFSTAGAGVVTVITKSTLMGAETPNGGRSLHVGNGNTAVLGGNLMWTSSGETCRAEGSATIISGGYNLGPVASCQLSEPTDQLRDTFGDFRLAPFAYYGGPLQTFLPQADSPAVDVRPCESLDQIDMRLRPRGVDGNADGVAACDAGAVERQRSELPGSLFRNGFEDLAAPGGA